MSLTTITLTASFERGDGQPAQGSLTATLSEPIQNGTSQVDPTPILGVLNPAGQLKNLSGLPFTLLANDDAGTLPAGTVYRFVIVLDSAPVREFEAIVPHLATAGTIDLSALDPTLP